VIAHLGTLDFVEARDNVVFLGPPGTGKTHLATGLGIRSFQAGHRVGFATAAAMIDRLVHHAEVVNLKGDSYRLKDRDLRRVQVTDLGLRRLVALPPGAGVGRSTSQSPPRRWRSPQQPARVGCGLLVGGL
jgi:hypothetical protein